MSAADRQGVSITSIIAAALSISFVVGGFVVFAEYEAVLPSGSSKFLLLSPFAVLPLSASIIVAPVAVVFCFWRRSRRTAAAVFLSCLFVAVSIFLSIRIGRQIRNRAFYSLAERSAVLVDAIKAYEDAYGEPPETLNAIVPEFMQFIPRTGMGAYPEYKYIVSQHDRYDGNPWVLVVFTPSGVPDFDQFMYYPLQNYPTSWQGNPLERVRDWAYMHE